MQEAPRGCYQVKAELYPKGEIQLIRLLTPTESGRGYNSCHGNKTQHCGMCTPQATASAAKEGRGWKAEKMQLNRGVLLILNH